LPAPPELDLAKGSVSQGPHQHSGSYSSFPRQYSTIIVIPSSSTGYSFLFPIPKLQILQGGAVRGFSESPGTNVLLTNRSAAPARI